MLAYALRNKYYPVDHPLRKYFIPGLSVKIIGAISIGLIYHYYYKGGDTFDYFFHIKLVNSSLSKGISVWWRVLTNTEDTQSAIESLISSEKYYTTIDTITIYQIGSVIGLLCFSLYLPLVTLIAFISFLGTWQIFRFFYLKYPDSKSLIAITTLFIPTTCIWGSGLFKDTFCQMAIGWILISSYNIIRHKQKFILNIFILLINALLIYKVKIYIFISFIPLLLIYSISEKVINSSRKRIALISSLLIITIIAFNTNKIISYFIADTSKYALNNISEYSTKSRDYLLSKSIETEGSSFDIGDYEPTPAGLLSKFGPAVNATLFRPYIWETRKPIVLLSAIQGLIALILVIIVTLRLLLRNKLYLLFDNTIIFSLTFAILFSFMIGISTSNFGSLSRYKIPIEPFLFSTLVILYQKTQQKKLTVRDVF